jgi:hypothetical protein
MNITKRLYTYPVLSEERDDYKNSTFDATVNYKMNGVNSLHMEFDIKMDNVDLQSLIGTGQAEYVIHIECSNTSYRTTIHSITDQVEKDIQIGRINGKMEVVVLIVSKMDINGLKVKDWVEDYQDIDFDISKGSILAYKNIPSFDIIKNYEELSSTSSIFKVYKRFTKEPKPMEVDLGSSQIGIGLGLQEFEIYSKFFDKVQFQPLLNTMVVFPALVYVFEELKQDDGIENNDGKKWFVSLSKAYEKRGINLEEEIKSNEKTSVQLAQEAMELPLTAALKTMSDIFDTNEEEES